MSPLIFTHDELRQSVSLGPDTLQVVAEGFGALARGEVIMPPFLRLVIDSRGELDAKAAYVRGTDHFVIKIASAFFGNPDLGLPSVTGLMVVFAAETGQIEALLLDEGYLTQLRTAAAGALAARYLAPQTCRTVGVIGAGVQAGWQIRALRLVCSFEEVVVWARRLGKAHAFADELATALNTVVEVVDSPEAVMGRSAVVITATPATAPLIWAEQLHPGLHITAVGSDAPDKHELDPRILAQADRVVCDHLGQSLSLGELHHAADLGLDVSAVDELGEIVLGAKPGRQYDREVTVCDLTGTGVQDTAIALHAYAAARARGFGRRV